MCSGPSTELPGRRGWAQQVYDAARQGRPWEHLVDPDDAEQVTVAVRMAAAGQDMRRRMDTTAAVGGWVDPATAGWDAAIGATSAVLRGLAGIPGATLGDAARHINGLSGQHHRMAGHVRPDGWEPGG